MQLRPYQLEGARFLLDNPRSMVLAPMGSGKTAMTLTAMHEALTDGMVKRFLVLAPKRVCVQTWPQEFATWWRGDLTDLAICQGSPSQRKAALHGDARVVVCNYDNLQWLSEQDLESFDAVVFDELTKLKNSSGVRFKAFYRVIDLFYIRWGLTGTFTSNGLEDVFGQCKIIDIGLLGKHKTKYLQEYFYCVNRDYNDWVPVPGALERVMARIKPATFVLENKEYADGLPALHKVRVPCVLPDRRDYEQMQKQFVLELDDTKVLAETAGTTSQKLRQIASGFLYGKGNDYWWLSSHKFDQLDELLEENQSANTILVYNMEAELIELKRRYKSRLMTLDERGAVDRWNAGKLELLALHPSAGGHGLNLQHGGHMMVFVSLPWSLDEFEQVIGRLHRSGQKHEVWVYFLLTEDTIDERILATLEDKRSFSEKAFRHLEEHGRCATAHD